MSHYRYGEDVNEGLVLLWKLWIYAVMLALSPLWLLGLLHRWIKRR